MKIMILSLFIGNVIFVAAANLLTPLFALFVAQVSPFNSETMAGLLWGTFVVATVIFLSIMSSCKWINRRNDVDLLIAGMLFKMAGWSIYIVTPSMGSMLCAQLLLGAGEASGVPAFNALLTSTSIKGKIVARKLFSMWQISASIAMAAAAFAGGYVVKMGSFRSLFICMIALSATAVIATVVFRRHLLTIREQDDAEKIAGR